MKIFRPSARAEPVRRRLFCFPYAGGGAAIFRTWADLLPDDVELCVPTLPGRDGRVGEKPIAEMAALVDLLAADVASRLDLPYALFGHSMGAFVAFELAHRIARSGLRLPSHLFVSAQRAPQCPYPHTPLFVLPDDQLLAGVLARYQSIPHEVLEHREFMAVLLPMLRADFTLVEDYRPRNRGPLRSPITVFGGADDRLIAAEQLLAWSQETTAACDVHIVPGGHFFLESARLEMLDIIRRVWVS